jgi:phosphoenolpyruvate carboxylase
VAESTEHIPGRLRYHIRVLGDLLGETIADQFGDDLVAKLENVRKLSKSRRQTDPHLKTELLRALKGLQEQELTAVTRAFNQFLQLSNIAEQVQTIAGKESTSEPESLLENMFQTLLDAGKSPNEISNTIYKLKCDLVLTAHPTQITRRTLIQKYEAIANVLQSLESGAPNQHNLKTELKRLITEIWHTDEIHLEKSTPQDEAIWSYAVIENSFWHAVPQTWRHLDELLARYTGNSLPITFSPIKISSWMGGDRDRSPHVTTEVTREVLRLARWMACDLYLRDIDRLLSRLSVSDCNSELEEIVGGSSQDPYRHVLRNLREKLQDARLSAEGKSNSDEVILDHADVFGPLHTCYKSLHDCGMGIIADGELKDTLVRLACFGVTLVNLDVRQNSEQHELLLDELTQHLEIGSYKSWSESKRQAFLVSELENPRPLIPRSWQPSIESQEVLSTFRLIADTRAAGIASYVVSMAQQPSDILEVILLLKKCGLTKMIPVAPLFETLEDLDQAEDTLLQLFKIRWYRDHIDDKQQVMIDYSDSIKDTGQMAAAWAQYRAQESMVRICGKYGVELMLFHGRDGTMGGFSGPTHRPSLSHPPGSARNGMRLIEQGETIQFKYGSPDLALMNLNQVLSVAIEAMLLPPPAPEMPWRQVMDHLSEVASNEYNAVVSENDDFLAYFNQGTLRKELAELALGSPVARKATGATIPESITEMSATEWIFAWTQKRLMLHAWLGTSKALDFYSEPERLSTLQEMMANWPFFRTQIDMLEKVLAMADIEISNDYDSILVSSDLRQLADLFTSELDNLTSQINQIKQQDRLLATAPEITTSLSIRNTYTDPLHFLQMELMSRRRTNPRRTSVVINKALLVTIAGIAAGMRSTS